MKIISKFKDYYDSASSYGVDESVVYVRKLEVLDEGEVSYMADAWDYGDTEIEFSKFGVLGFCGELYPLITKYEPRDRLGRYDSPTPDTVLYGRDAVEMRLKDHTDRDRKYEDKTFVEDEGRPWWNSKTYQEIYDELVKNERLKQIFAELDTPVFYVRPSGKINRKDQRVWLRVIKNPCLKELGFFRMKSAPVAFSEIQQFISNALAKDTEVEVPVGDNEVIGRSKGFDSHSFRKEPTKKKYGKKNRRDII